MARAHTHTHLFTQARTILNAWYAYPYAHGGIYAQARWFFGSLKGMLLLGEIQGDNDKRLAHCLCALSVRVRVREFR